MRIVENTPKTRHLYTFQDGEVVVLEHITTISTITEGDEHKFFYVGIAGGTCIAAKDVEIEVPRSHLLSYKTTERAELINALGSI